MPSGAKKRKAAKKKLQKEAHNTTNYDGSHSLGNDSAKSHDERDSDGGERERESSEERVVNDHEVDAVGEQNLAEFSKEVKSEENYNDVKIDTEDDVTETKNGHHKRSSSSSSSSSSESGDDEVTIEEEKPVAAESGELEQQVQSSLPAASRENLLISEVIHNSVVESIPVEESVKKVVSLPQEEITGNECADVESSVSSQVIESELKQNLDEVLPSATDKDKVSSGVTHFLEKVETKVIEVVEEGDGNLSGSVEVAARDGEGLLPQSSGVMSADACCGDNNVNTSETLKYVEEKPLVSSAPLPVRRTSWMNCCGLFEVFSGAASR